MQVRTLSHLEHAGSEPGTTQSGTDPNGHSRSQSPRARLFTTQSRLPSCRRLYQGLSTKKLSFVSNKSQARITVARAAMLVALSLSALPMAWDAVRVDTGCARGRRQLRAKLGIIPGCPWVRGGTLCSPEPGVVGRPRCVKAEKAQAGVETHEGGGTQEGGEPFFGRAGCGAPCLAPGSEGEVFEPRRRTDARRRIDNRLRFEAGAQRGRKTPPGADGQTKAARSGFLN